VISLGGRGSSLAVELAAGVGVGLGVGFGVGVGLKDDFVFLLGFGFLVGAASASRFPQDTDT
jgi:hypothetical protein